MSRIIIYKNPNGDTRTAPKNISFEQFQEANDMHIQDVKNVMNELALNIMIAGDRHDSTKKFKERLFYENFLSTEVGRIYRHFKGSTNYIRHIAEHTETGEDMVVYSKIDLENKNGLGALV